MDISPYLPPKGGSSWAAPAQDQLDLLYLAWGRRNYGLTPLKEERRADWLYVAPNRGCPTALLNGRRRKVPTGHVLIVAPGCTVGWTDSPIGHCDIQTWVWRNSPHHPSIVPALGNFSLIELSSDQRVEITRVHSLCRREVQLPDLYTRDAMTMLRTRLDLCLVRGPEGRASAASSAQRVELGVRWLSENPDEHAPVRRLCDYLQLSPATLHRLFRKHLGHGPRQAALEIRIAEARRLITANGWSVKATAYHLGYKHSNDLSRALSNESQKRSR